MTYEREAENRLVRVAPASSPASGEKKVTYAYDYMNQRVERIATDWDPSANGGAGAWETSSSRSIR